MLEDMREASEINRRDCIYLFVDILIRPSTASSQKMNSNPARMRLVKQTGPQLRWRRREYELFFRSHAHTSQLNMAAAQSCNGPAQSFFCLSLSSPPEK